LASASDSIKNPFSQQLFAIIASIISASLQLLPHVTVGHQHSTQVCNLPTCLSQPQWPMLLHHYLVFLVSLRNHYLHIAKRVERLSCFKKSILILMTFVCTCTLE